MARTVTPKAETQVALPTYREVLLKLRDEKAYKNQAYAFIIDNDLVAKFQEFCGNEKYNEFMPCSF